MSELESDILKRTMVVASDQGATVFRNNTGMGWTGQATQFSSHRQVHVGPGDVLVRHARPLHAGLIKGSSDAIGWIPTEITQDMVGNKAAVFLALETKSTGGRLTIEQKNFIDRVNEAGGVGLVVTDPSKLKLL